MTTAAEECGVDPQLIRACGSNVVDAFECLLREVKAQPGNEGKKVVLLIDECDAPPRPAMAAVTSLTNELASESVSSPANVAAVFAAERVVEEAMKPLYGAIKKAEDSWQLVFVTCMTKLALLRSCVPSDWDGVCYGH